MASEASKAASRKAPALWPIFVIGLLMLVLFWIVNKGLLGWDVSNPEPEEAARAALRAKNLSELQAENASKLDSYAWVDRAKGSVQIPVSAAMDLVLADLNASGPRAAYPVTPPAAAPSAPPAAPIPAAPGANPTP